MKIAPLIVDALQLESINNVLSWSVKYYKEYSKFPTNLVDFFNAHMHYEVGNGMYQRIHKQLFQIQESEPKIYRVEVTISLTEALFCCASILPTNNYTYNETTVNILVEYAKKIIAESEVINRVPENIKPITTPQGYHNSSTSIQDYLNEQ